MNIVITGATGGIGSALVADLSRDNFVITVSHLLERDTIAEAIICCHAAPVTADLNDSLTIDVVGTMTSINHVLFAMKSRRAGRIILLSSIRAHRPRSSQVIYATAKAAVEGMTRGLAVLLGEYGITANCIAPGALINTPRTQENIRLGNVSADELQAQTPGWMATTQTIASCMRWLLSPAADAVTGQVFTLDGGWSVKG